MRNHIRELIDNAQRSGDRVGVDGFLDTPAQQIAADTVRLARLAASIHLADAAWHVAMPDRADELALPVREYVD